MVWHGNPRIHLRDAISISLTVVSLAISPTHSTAGQVSIKEVVLEDFSDIVTLKDLGVNDFSGNSGTVDKPIVYGRTSLACSTPDCFLRFAWNFQANPVEKAFTGLFFSLFGLTDSHGTVFAEHNLDLDCIDCPMSEPGGNRSLQDLHVRVRYQGGSPLTLRMEISGAAVPPTLPDMRFKRFTITG